MLRLEFKFLINLEVLPEDLEYTTGLPPAQNSKLGPLIGAFDWYYDIARGRSEFLKLALQKFNILLASKVIHDFYYKNRKEIKAKKSIGQMLIACSTLVKTNIIVINYGENLKKHFGPNYSNVIGYYLNSKSKTVMTISHRAPTSIQKSTSVFTAGKYNEQQTKVSYQVVARTTSNSKHLYNFYRRS